MKKIFNEKRKHERVSISIPVQYKRLNDPENAVKTGSLTWNLSEGGVGLKTKEFISKACRVVMELSLDTLQKPVRVISKVAWIKKVPSSDDFTIGSQFLEISRSDRETLEKYINGATYQEA